MTRSKWLSAFLFVLGLSAAVKAPAASLDWRWSYLGDGVAASGTFLTLNTPDAQGGYQITSITGSRNGEAIIALQATGTSIPGNEPYTVDNLVFPATGAQLTKDGFGFELADGTYSNPFYAGFLPVPGYLEFYSMPASGKSTEDPVTFSAAIVPEPSTVGFSCVAVFFLWGYALRRSIRTAV